MANVSSWCDIIAVTVGPYDTLGLKADGNLVITGLSSWRFQSVKLFSGIRPIKPKKTEMLERKEELENLKGLFFGGKRRELETGLAQIEEELNAL